MKTANFIKTVKSYSIFLLACFALVAFKSNYEKRKVFTKEFDVNASSIVDIKHERGNQNIEYYDGNKAIVEVELVVSGDNEQDVETVISKYSIDVNKSGNNVSVNSTTNIKSQIHNSNWFGSKHVVRFKDGSEIRTKIDMIKATMTLKIPKVERLELSNKYNDINTGDLPFDLKVNLFSGAINTGNLDGDFELDMKYGKGRLGNLKNVELDLFDSNLTFQNVGKVDLKDKYSELDFQDAGSVEMDIFDADISFGNIAGDFEIDEKYSEIEAGVVSGNGNWDLFDSKVRIESIGNLEVRSKYSDFDIGKTGDLRIESFDDNFDIEYANSIESRYSKYSEYDIDELNTTLAFLDSFDDDIDIRKVTNFGGIELEGKYSELLIPIPASVKYVLDAELKYGEIEYPESNFDMQTDRKDHSTREIYGKIKGADDSSPKVKIDVYNTKVRLNR